MGENYPKVGVGVMILKEGKVLIGKRKSSHGEGEYSFPGGHLEYMESFEDCARRETFEEAGIKIKNLTFLHVGNIFTYKPKHYINIVLTAEWESGEPEVKEPEKIENWQWYDMHNIPEPMFKQSALAFNSYKTGQNYYNFVE